MGKFALLLDCHPSCGRLLLILYFPVQLGPLFEPLDQFLLLNLSLKHFNKALAFAILKSPSIDSPHFVISAESVNHPIIEEADHIDRIIRDRNRTLDFVISIHYVIISTFQLHKSILEANILNLTLMVVSSFFFTLQHTLDLEDFCKVIDVVMLKIELQQLGELAQHWYHSKEFVDGHEFKRYERH